MKSEIINWQDKGFFGEIWNDDDKKVVTVPYPNLKCPEELYRTHQECFDACEKKMNEIHIDKSAD